MNQHEANTRGVEKTVYVIFKHLFRGPLLQGAGAAEQRLPPLIRRIYFI
jgi:hypothetical protein